MKINNPAIVERWNDVMFAIGCEHVTIGDRLSDLEIKKEYFGVERGVSVAWMLDEADYWLSCYYEGGNVRCDDRFRGPDEYRDWVSETRKLKRLIRKLQNMEDAMVAEWD